MLDRHFQKWSDPNAESLNSTSHSSEIKDLMDDIIDNIVYIENIFPDYISERRKRKMAHRKEILTKPTIQISETHSLSPLVISNQLFSSPILIRNILGDKSQLKILSHENLKKRMNQGFRYV